MAQNQSPAKKRQRPSLNLAKCIICQRATEEKLTVGEKGTESVKRASEIRRDEVYERLLTTETTESPISYHRKCFQTYTSKTNLASVEFRQQQSLVPVPQPSTDTPQTDALPAVPVTRAVRTPVDWSLCIVCQKLSHKKDRNLLKIASRNREISVKTAAEIRDDSIMLLRIAGQDLIARDAVYHQSCLGSYTSKTNLSKITKSPAIRATSTSSQNDETVVYNEAFKTLIDAIEKDLQNGKAFLMSSLLEMFKSYLPEDFSNTSYRSDRLKSKLQKHYGDLIVIQSQYGQGKSSIVFSSKITLKDAVKAAAKLKERLKMLNWTIVTLAF